MGFVKVEDEITRLDENNKELVGVLVNIEQGAYGKLFVVNDDPSKEKEVTE